MSSPAKDATKDTTKDTPKVSLIVPIYNVAKYLPCCLDSILAETHQNLEILLVDDGSTDASGRIAADYAAKDPRITVIYQKNQGQSAARNTGLAHATGEYLCFIDGDDEIATDYVAKLLQPFINNPSVLLSICGIRFRRLATHTTTSVYLNPLPPRAPRQSFKSYILKLLAIDGRLYSSVNKLYRTDLAKKLRFDTELNFAEDTKFVLDYLSLIKNSTTPSPDSPLAFVLEPLYLYNVGTETSTMKKTATIWANWQRSYENLKFWLGPHPSASEKFWLHLVHLRWRLSHLKQVHRAKQVP